MFGMKKKKPQLVYLDAVDHPVLGRLEPYPSLSGHLGALLTLGGAVIDLSVTADGGPLEAALSLASDAVAGFAEIDTRCRAIIASNFLASYNSDWRFGAVHDADGTVTEFEKPLLTEAQFVSALTPAGLEISGGSFLILSYLAGEMFWGHSVCVMSFDGLALVDITVELQG